MADKPKLWGIGDTHLVYTTKEDAETMSEWFSNRFPNTPKGMRQRYYVHEIFPDCFVNKIRKGYTTWCVTMLRDGSVSECKETPVLPGRHGFNYGTIQPLSFIHNYVTKQYTGVKAIVYRCLAKDKEEAIALCEKYRIKTLIDDIWNNNKKVDF